MFNDRSKEIYNLILDNFNASDISIEADIDIQTGKINLSAIKFIEEDNRITLKWTLDRVEKKDSDDIEFSFVILCSILHKRNFDDMIIFKLERDIPYEILVRELKNSIAIFQK